MLHDSNEIQFLSYSLKYFFIRKISESIKFYRYFFSFSSMMSASQLRKFHKLEGENGFNLAGNFVKCFSFLKFVWTCFPRKKIQSWKLSLIENANIVRWQPRSCRFHCGTFIFLALFAQTKVRRESLQREMS